MRKFFNYSPIILNKIIDDNSEIDHFINDYLLKYTSIRAHYSCFVDKQYLSDLFKFLLTFPVIKLGSNIDFGINSDEYNLKYMESMCKNNKDVDKTLNPNFKLGSERLYAYYYIVRAVYENLDKFKYIIDKINNESVSDSSFINSRYKMNPEYFKELGEKIESSYEEFKKFFFIPEDEQNKKLRDLRNGKYSQEFSTSFQDSINYLLRNKFIEKRKPLKKEIPLDIRSSIEFFDLLNYQYYKFVKEIQEKSIINTEGYILDLSHIYTLCSNHIYSMNFIITNTPENIAVERFNEKRNEYFSTLDEILNSLKTLFSMLGDEDLDINSLTFEKSSKIINDLRLNVEKFSLDKYFESIKHNRNDRLYNKQVFIDLYNLNNDLIESVPVNLTIYYNSDVHNLGDDKALRPIYEFCTSFITPNLKEIGVSIYEKIRRLNGITKNIQEYIMAKNGSAIMEALNYINGKNNINFSFDRNHLPMVNFSQYMVLSLKNSNEQTSKEYTYTCISHHKKRIVFISTEENTIYKDYNLELDFFPNLKTMQYKAFNFKDLKKKGLLYFICDYKEISNRIYKNQFKASEFDFRYKKEDFLKEFIKYEFADESLAFKTPNKALSTEDKKEDNKKTKKNKNLENVKYHYFFIAKDIEQYHEEKKLLENVIYDMEKDAGVNTKRMSCNRYYGLGDFKAVKEDIYGYYRGVLKGPSNEKINSVQDSLGFSGYEVYGSNVQESAEAIEVLSVFLKNKNVEFELKDIYSIFLNSIWVPRAVLYANSAVKNTFNNFSKPDEATKVVIEYFSKFGETILKNIQYKAFKSGVDISLREIPTYLNKAVMEHSSGTGKKKKFSSFVFKDDILNNKYEEVYKNLHMIFKAFGFESIGMDTLIDEVKENLKLKSDFK